jgi:hypothetical protein
MTNFRTSLERVLDVLDAGLPGRRQTIEMTSNRAGGSGAG